MAAAQAERERAAEQSTRSLVRFYPALKQVPPLERHAVLRDAREFAAGYVSSRLFLAVMSIVLAALLALVFTGHAKLALAAGCLIVLLSIGRQLIELVLIRKYLSQKRSRGR